LREKLRDDPAEPRVILTVRGKGYMFAKSAG
jgi:two-component system alkaline phosphatase synthesis response regulator PhoP